MCLEKKVAEENDDKAPFDAPLRSHSFGVRRFAPVYLAPLGSKCGNGHARWMLCESAQAYRWKPRVSAALSKRQEGQSRAVKKLSWRMQQRLTKRYSRLRARGIRDSKCIVAIARELSAFIWELQNKLDLPMPKLAESKAA